MCFGLSFDFGLKSLQGAIPELVQPCPDGPEPGWIDGVDASCSLRAVRDETGGFQDLEVLGDGRSTDRQALSEFADCPWAAGQPLENRAAGRIGQSGERTLYVSYNLP